MASLNRGIFIDDKNIDRSVIRDEVKRVFKTIPGVTDVVFFSDSEITSIATTLADRIRKAMENVQDGLVGVNDPNDLYADPVFLEKFNSTLVINVREDFEAGEKFVFIDRTNAINVDDITLTQKFGVLAKSGNIKTDMLLHIPMSADKRSQSECFYIHETNSVRVEVIGGGAPVIMMHICKYLSPEEIAKRENKEENKSIVAIPIAYGSVAEMYDEMISFILDQDRYDIIYLGISRTKGDTPVMVEVHNFRDLYDKVSLMQAQIEPYGVIESNIIPLSQPKIKE